MSELLDVAPRMMAHIFDGQGQEIGRFSLPSRKKVMRFEKPDGEVFTDEMPEVPDVIMFAGNLYAPNFAAVSPGASTAGEMVFVYIPAWVFSPLN